MGATTYGHAVALALAGDARVTGADLLPLAVHSEPDVRAMVAGRVDCPTGALISLGHDHSPEVLLALIGNVRAPSSLVRNLAEHPAEEVAGAAEKRLRGIAQAWAP